MNFKIEIPQSDADYSQIEKFFAKIWAEEFEIILENQIENYKSSIIFFVRENDEIISAVTAHFSKDQWKIGRFATDKNHRGKWIGSQIFAKILQYFEEKNIPEIFIRAEITKVDFYKKFGFEICGEAEKSGNTEAILMKKIFKNTQMENIFDEWNEDKKILHNTEMPNFYVNEREIWHIKLWQNIGSESNGKKDFRRPVLILKKIWSMFFVVPLTTKWKENRFYHTISDAKYISKNHIPEISRAQLSQVKIIDKRRFIHLLWVVSEKDFSEIKEKLKTILF